MYLITVFVIVLFGRLGVTHDCQSSHHIRNIPVFVSSQREWFQQATKDIDDDTLEESFHRASTVKDVCGMTFFPDRDTCNLTADGCTTVTNNCSYVNETIVNCTCSNMTDIPHNIPANTTHLIISHTCLSTLSADSFANFSSLISLDLSANYYLTHIHEDVFRHLTQLTDLSMTCFRNKTADGSKFPYRPYELPRTILSPLEKLEKLDLFGWTGFTRKHLNNVKDVLNNLNTTSLYSLTLEFVNGIYPDGVLWTIAPSYFRGPAMENLAYLDLANNMIVSIRPKVLCALRRLKHLNISYNVITGGDFDLLMLNLSYMTELTHFNFSYQNYIIFSKNPNVFLSALKTRRPRDLTSPIQTYWGKSCFYNVTFAPKLEVLDISHRNMILHPFMICRPRIVGPNSLKYLNMSHSWLDTTLFGDDWNFPSLLELNLDTSREVYTSRRQFKKMQNLTHLNIARSYLDEILTNKTSYRHLFKNLNMPRLTYIDMSGNYLVYIHPYAFAYFPSLTNISLHHNKLSEIKFFINKTKHLKYLDLSDNPIVDIPGEVRGDWSVNGNFIVNLTSNTMECSCATKTFCEWALDARHDHKITIAGLSCYNRFTNGTKMAFFGNIKHTQLTSCCCIGIYVAFSLYLTFLCLTSVVCLVYYYKLSLIYHWYRIIVHFRRPRREKIADEVSYDAFVCYSMRDADWVVYQLCQYLEEKHTYRLCVNERDFIAGKPVLNNIKDSFEKSRKVILVISPNSLREHLEFELHMACGEFLSKVICVLLVPPESLPSGRLPAGLEYLLSTQSYLIWPKQLERRNTFWLKLMTALGDPLFAFQVESEGPTSGSTFLSS